VNDDHSEPATIAMSNDSGHRRLPRTLPQLDTTSKIDPPHSSSLRTSEDEDKRRKKKQKKMHKDKKESEQLNHQSEPQIVNDHTEISKF